MLEYKLSYKKMGSGFPSVCNVKSWLINKLKQKRKKMNHSEKYLTHFLLKNEPNIFSRITKNCSCQKEKV